MRVAILGNGSAGVMAVAHLSRQFPELTLFHVFDPGAPSLGVGEGTTAGFRLWLEEVAPGSFAAFCRTCHATSKRGVQFENWGIGRHPFVHDFVPQDNPGLHISAEQLPAFFEPWHRATPVHGRVAQIRTQPGGATLQLEVGSTLTVDLIIDARGFPKTLAGDHLALPWIPTDAALLLRGPACSGLERTRAVARPHGWIFVIPLSNHTSYGYVFGSRTSTLEEVETDFRAFLESEGVRAASPRVLRFPNFVCQTVFDGRVCRLGNAASFIEPLEATAIALIKTELVLLSQWLRLALRADGNQMARDLVTTVNVAVRRTVIEVSLFVAWHYAAGSRFATPFWTHAQERFRRGLGDSVSEEVRALFETHLERASEFSAAEILALRSKSDLEWFLHGRDPFPPPFGGITPLGFAQVADGLAGRATIPRAGLPSR